MRAETRAKWQDAAVAEHYVRARWRSAWRANRDLRVLQRTFERHGIASPGRILDAPCGAGRLHHVLEPLGTWFGIDVSSSMLNLAEQCGARPVVRGDLARLPFRSAAFPLVVACRILHHLDPPALSTVTRELVRVSSDWIVASFWDSATLPAVRSRLWRSRAHPTETRRSRSRSEIRAAFAAAGAEVQAFETDTRLFSRQCFAVARK